MSDIDLLEFGGGRFSLQHEGEPVELLDPRDMHFQAVLLCLQAQIAPGTPGCADWKRAVIFDRWRWAHDLPHFEDARRLAYLVDHYRGAIANDLRVHANVDLGELWRARRWTHLLDLIDRLPAHSWFSATISGDKEHAEMLARAIAERRAAGQEDKAPSGPSLVGWTPEVAALHHVLDAVRRVEWTVAAVNAGKKAPDPPKPAPRPISEIEIAIKRADMAERKARHEALAARVLRRKP